MVHPLRQYNLPRKKIFFSYSSGRQISPLSESVVTDHFRQVGSFSTGGGGGLEFQFQNRPPLSSVPVNMSVTRNPDRNLLLQEVVHTLLQKGTVELMNPPLTPGYYSLLFLVPKKNGKMRPVIDLSVLNQHLIVPHFKMETNRSIRGSIRLGMWTTSLDLTDAYFHIPISPKFRKFLRFVGEDRVYAFKAMPFGLSTAPLVFTRVFQEVVAHLHSQSILIHFFLFGRFLIEKYVPISTQTGFPNFMEEVGASSQPRPHFSRGTLSDTSGASFSHRGKHFNSTITGEQICSGIVSNSS